MKKNSQQQSDVSQQALALWDIAIALGLSQDEARRELPEVATRQATLTRATPRDWDQILSTLEGAIGLLREIIAARKKQQETAKPQPVGA